MTRVFCRGRSNRRETRVELEERLTKEVWLEKLKEIEEGGEIRRGFEGQVPDLLK